MKHNIHIKGHAFRLRPIEYTDAAFIVEVRTPERSAFMQPISHNVQAQEAFLEEYFQRPNETTTTLSSSRQKTIRERV